MFTKKFLMRWWRRAQRRRVLHSALDREERSILYLAMRAFDEIRNSNVGTIIVKILAKLNEALKSPFVRKMETFGIQRARIVSSYAVELGFEAAKSWAVDVGFVKYLTALELNAPTGWGI